MAVAWSFLYFFCLLAAYYMLRSVRETMAIVGGVRNIPWLFTGTFTVMILVAPVYGWGRVALSAQKIPALGLLLFYRQYPAVLRGVRLRPEPAIEHGMDWPDILRLAERIQPVCRVRILEFHG